MARSNDLIILVSVIAVLGSMGCDEPTPAGNDGGSVADGGAPPDPDFVASCAYENSFSMSPECVEYRGAGWSEATATAACRRVFLNTAGELRLGEPCRFPNEIGRCTVGDLDADGYVIVSAGEPSACGAAQTGCETFAGGTFDAAASCDSCAATGDEGPGAVVPTAPDCRDPLPGEPPGDGPDGQVCTWSVISASTEPGRRYVDYADCDVVRSQRPYYAEPDEAPMDPDDPRLDDTEYMAELDWVRSQAEASACSCCHSDSGTPSGPAAWSFEAGPLWIDTVSDEALAMMAGYTDSAAFGFFEVEDNNGFDRSTTGLPTTDIPRLRAFAARELSRRGLTVEEAEVLPPFAPFFRELVDYEPEACAEGIGVDADGAVRWTGGGARYVWVMEADARSPGAPPNWDLPEGTLWAIRAEPDAEAHGCGFGYGEVGDGVVQRAPADGAAPPALTSGQTYYLAVMRDIAQPITRCLFTAP